MGAFLRVQVGEGASSSGEEELIKRRGKERVRLQSGKFFEKSLWSERTNMRDGTTTNRGTGHPVRDDSSRVREKGKSLNHRGQPGGGELLSADLIA